MKNIIEINSNDESEFSESKIEKDYKFMDLNIKEMEKKDSSNIQMKNHLRLIKEINENEEDEEDEMKPLSHSHSLYENNYSLIDNNSNDVLSLSTLS